MSPAADLARAYASVDPATFWPKVRVGGPDECWPWMAATNGKYGRYNASRKKGGQQMLAHRASFCLANPGVRLGELSVCHSCDNPICVNPAHLRLDTQAENVREEFRRSRRKVKLTAIQVLKIRSSKSTLAALAKEHGVSPATVWLVKNDLIYREVR